MRNVRSKVIAGFCMLILFSCGASKNLVYMSDLQGSEEYKTKVYTHVKPKIKPEDILSITVSSLNPESNVLFNSGMIQRVGTANGTFSNNAESFTKINDGYLVDDLGNVNFPVLGKFTLGGLTKEEATEKLTSELKKYIKEPIVNIRYMNFKVTVIGEVNNPSTFIIPTERINILEALGLAGDMTQFGLRDNVLIIRESDGVRSATRLNLNNKDILESPNFYLQQNDVIYVEPSKVKQIQANMNTKFFAIAGIIVPIATALAWNLHQWIK
jgi:polysaccharide biosynthesis/export protein